MIITIRDRFKIDEEKCTRCGICTNCCPTGAILINDDETDLVGEFCISCGICEDECPFNAIEVIC